MVTGYFKVRLEGEDFQPHPWPPKRWEGQNIEWIPNSNQWHQSCLHNEASIKTQNDRIIELPDSWTFGGSEAWYTQREQRGSLTSYVSPCASPCPLWYLLISWERCLDSVSCFTKLIEAEEGVLGTTVYGGFVRSSEDILGFGTGIWNEGTVLRDKHSIYEIWLYSQIVSKSNWRMPSWWLLSCWWEEIPPHSCDQRWNIMWWSVRIGKTFWSFFCLTK